MLELWAKAVLASGNHHLAISVLPSYRGAASHPGIDSPRPDGSTGSIGTDRRRPAGRARAPPRTGRSERGSIPAHASLLSSSAYSPSRSPRLVPTHPDHRRTRSSAVRKDLLDLARAASEPGVVEIIGPAGVGKTRLVLEYLADAPPSRWVRFVDLTGLSQPETILAGAAGALGIATAHSPVELADALDADSVLVLDNCEHLAGSVGDLVTGIVSHRNDVTVMCTSRTRLVSDSRCLDLAQLATREATELFTDRARRNRSAFEETGSNDTELATVVAACEGLPLAIELMSARERVLGALRARSPRPGRGPLDAGL